MTCPHCNRETAWWINGWFKTGRSGIEFLSLSLKVKEDKPASKPTQQPEPRPAHPDDNHDEPDGDEVPF